MDGHDNSFDVLRLLAALAVIAFHCAPLQGLVPWSMGDLNLGALGVGAFFVISGYLVSASLIRSTSLKAYFAKRLLRIEPGLIASLAVTAFVIGAYATSLPLGDYLRDKDVYLYVLRNALLYPVAYDLPGVFDHNVISAVNGSLWTLRVEFTFYIALAVLGGLKLLRTGALTLIVAVLGAAALALAFLGRGLVPAGLFPIALMGLQYGFLFFAGSLLQLIKRPLPSWTLASALLLLTPAWILGLPVLIVKAGSVRSLRLPADLSYGLYIYAFPLQQLLAAGGALTFWGSVALTLPFAALSWFLVEHPALKWKRGAARASVEAAALSS
jgi:peptidoglycan/LPS O-acetylase OafA/YrhL